MYFACDWVINRAGLDDIEQLSESAADLNCFWWYRIFYTEEGLGGARFIVRMPSEKVFQEFLKAINGLVFKDWYSIDLSNLPQTELPPDDFKPVRFRTWSPNNQMNFMRG